MLAANAGAATSRRAGACAPRRWPRSAADPTSAGTCVNSALPLSTRLPPTNTMRDQLNAPPLIVDVGGGNDCAGASIDCAGAVRAGRRSLGDVGAQRLGQRDRAVDVEQPGALLQQVRVGQRLRGVLQDRLDQRRRQARGWPAASARRCRPPRVRRSTCRSSTCASRCSGCGTLSGRDERAVVRGRGRRSRGLLVFVVAAAAERACCRARPGRA